MDEAKVIKRQRRGNQRTNVNEKAKALVKKSLKDLDDVWDDVWSALVDMGYERGDDLDEVLLYISTEIGDKYGLTDADDKLLSSIWKVAKAYITKEAPNMIEY